MQVNVKPNSARIIAWHSSLGAHQANGTQHERAESARQTDDTQLSATHGTHYPAGAPRPAGTHPPAGTLYPAGTHPPAGTPRLAGTHYPD